MRLCQEYELRVLCHMNPRGQMKSLTYEIPLVDQMLSARHRGLIPEVTFVCFPKAVQPLQCDSSLSSSSLLLVLQSMSLFIGLNGGWTGLESLLLDFVSHALWCLT